MTDTNFNLENKLMIFLTELERNNPKIHMEE